tara:strand:- start:1784 stop:2068 length:285 start_codon:yes stop_codon:yes gene_type:complete
VSSNAINTKCWICAERATFIEMDHANRKYYQCSAPDCGDFDISWRAEESKSDSHTFKEHLKSLANKHRGSDKVPLVTIGSDQNVKIEVINKTAL